MLFCFMVFVWVVLVRVGFREGIKVLGVGVEGVEGRKVVGGGGGYCWFRGNWLEGIVMGVGIGVEEGIECVIEIWGVGWIVVGLGCCSLKLVL